MRENNPASQNLSGLKQSLRALNSRNYRLFFGGQGISLIGTWLTRIATSWLVYRLTNSAFLLGLVGFAGQIPSFLLSPLAGVLVDRWNRHRILVITQILSMLQSLALAVLALSGIIAVWHILVLSIFQGLINAFDIPARQSFVVQMVEKKEDLPNAIALNSAIFNSARLLGPSIGGILIATVGEGICFLIDGISYLAVIASLLAMRIPKYRVISKGRPLMEELKEGITYALNFPPIRSILLLLGLISLAGIPYTVLMPVFAKDVLKGGPHTLGYLMAASGTGALAGAIFLATRKSVQGLGKLIAWSAGIFGVGLVIFSFSEVLWFSLLLMIITGFGMITEMASSNTVLQTIVEDDKRGRVMSFYAMAFMGMVPIGSLVAGSLASEIGAQYTVMIGGISCLVGSVWFARKLPYLRKIARPIYVKEGIIPEVAQGIQTATELTLPPKE